MLIPQEYLDRNCHPSQVGYWQLKAETTLKTGVEVSVFWNQWDGNIATVEVKDGRVIDHTIRFDEIVKPDYVAIKNYVWTDEAGPWLYIPAEVKP